MNTTGINERRSLGSPQRMESTQMRTQIRSLATLGGLLLLLALASLLFATTAAGTTTCELWAAPGELTMPDGEIVPVWGFADTVGVSGTVPGPMLLGNQGDTMVVTLHNDLPGETVALAFPGQDLLPDLAGAAPGGTATYTFTLSYPGTFLYEAGLTPDGTRQVAMGLYGGLVVRPLIPIQAYDDPTTAFDNEVLLVLGEIDPLLNADPAGFVMHEYAPRYWLINGQAYPDVPEIETLPGEKILMRYVNAGLESHWMGLLGLRQQIIGSDGQLQTSRFWAVAETVAAGQTLDTLVTIPADSVQDARYALYDTNLILHNASQRYVADGPVAFGGMMTFLRTVTTTVAPPAGPLASLAQVSPNPTTGAAGVTLTATLTSASAGGVTGAEFFTDTIGAPGTGSAMDLGAPGATAFIPDTTLATWPSGFIVFYVRGQDEFGWGPVGSVVLNLDKIGPDSKALSLEPEPTNGTSPVLLRATGDDHSHGRNNVVAATYTIDGGAAEAMNLARTDNPITAMTATLSVATLQGLAEGLHPIAITAEDSLGNPGAAGIITLTLDQTGPAAPVASLTPNPLDLSGAPPVTAVRLQARITDTLAAGVQSPLANAEAFVGAIGPDGTGFDLFPSDGLFDEIAEDAYFDIPIANFLLLAQGDHFVYVHGLDAAGNWGVFGQAIITIDRGLIDTVGPNITGLSVTLNPVARATIVNIAATASDPNLLSNVAGAEWFVDTDPGVGNGTPLQAADGAFDETTELLAGTIDVGGWPTGNYTIYVRAVDSLGNWGPVVSAPLALQNNVYIYLPIIMSNP
jgi:FtsP/CotA-like multicopper oxidase with cupredoxin domain